MHVAEERAPVRTTAPGAVARQLPGFGDLLHWPPGHSARVTTDAEVILFSAEAEHTQVVDHMADQLTA